MTSLKIFNVKIYGLAQSLIRSGYPMQTIVNERMDLDTTPLESLLIRGGKLGKAPQGSGHDNFLKGIIVQFDVNFTTKAWTEAERYHWFDFVSSCSTMHKLKDMDLSKVYNEYTDSRIIAIMQELQQEYKANPTQENLLRLLYSNPVGMKLTAGITTNYLQLKTIYNQRKNHRLPEWREFCQWIESLSYAKELGVCGNNN